MDWWRWAVLGLLGALIALGCWLLVLARRADGSLRGLRQQVRNIGAMLVRAGFKKGPTVDWNDDFKRTEVRLEADKTRWDWRAPRGGR